MILAIDPGNEQSAFVVFNGERLVRFGKWDNGRLLEALVCWDQNGGPFACADHLAIEMIASYGMPVGREVFDTCVWVGRFAQASGREWTPVFRRDVKLHLCGSARAKDGNVRTALLDLWGGKAAAVGTKKAPGPLYGVSADVWQALAVAVTYRDTRLETCSTSEPIASGEVSV